MFDAGITSVLRTVASHKAFPAIGLEYGGSVQITDRRGEGLAPGGVQHEVRLQCHHDHAFAGDQLVPLLHDRLNAFLL